jgi:hypothetical protein
VRHTWRIADVSEAAEVKRKMWDSTTLVGEDPIHDAD